MSRPVTSRAFSRDDENGFADSLVLRQPLELIWADRLVGWFGCARCPRCVANSSRPPLPTPAQARSGDSAVGGVKLNINVSERACVLVNFVLSWLSQLISWMLRRPLLNFSFESIKNMILQEPLLQVYTSNAAAVPCERCGLWYCMIPPQSTGKRCVGGGRTCSPGPSSVHVVLGMVPPPLPYTPRPTHDVMDAVMKIREESKKGDPARGQDTLLLIAKRERSHGLCDSAPGTIMGKGEWTCQASGPTPCFGIREPQAGKLLLETPQFFISVLLFFAGRFLFLFFFLSCVRGGERI